MTAIDGVISGLATDAPGDAIVADDGGREFADMFRRAQLDDAARQPRRRDRFESPTPGHEDADLGDRDLVGRRGRHRADDDTPVAPAAAAAPSVGRPVRDGGGDQHDAESAAATTDAPATAPDVGQSRPLVASPSSGATDGEDRAPVVPAHLSAMPAAMSTTLPATVATATAPPSAVLPAGTPAESVSAPVEVAADASTPPGAAAPVAPSGSPVGADVGPSAPVSTGVVELGPTTSGASEAATPVSSAVRVPGSPATTDSSSPTSSPDGPAASSATLTSSDTMLTSSTTASASAATSTVTTATATATAISTVTSAAAADTTTTASASAPSSGSAHGARPTESGVAGTAGSADARSGTVADPLDAHAQGGATVRSRGVAESADVASSATAPTAEAEGPVIDAAVRPVAARSDAESGHADERSALAPTPRAHAESARTTAPGAVPPADGSVDSSESVIDVVSAEVATEIPAEAARRDAVSSTPSVGAASPTGTESGGEIVDVGATTETASAETAELRQPARTAEIASRIIDQLARREAFEHAERTRGLNGDRLELEVATERFGVVRVEATDGADGLHLSLRSDGRADARALIDLAAQLREQFERDGVDLAGLDVGSERDAPGREPNEGDNTTTDGPGVPTPGSGPAPTAPLDSVNGSTTARLDLRL